MKFLPFICLFFVLSSVYSQSGLNWSQEIDVATSSFNDQHPRIVADRSGNPLVLWGNFSSSEVYFSRWNGSAFSSPLTLNPPSIPVFTASWAGPDIAAYGDTVYVVYKQIPEDTNHIFLVRSFDGGTTFSSPIQVDHLTDSSSRFPTITTDSIGNPIVAYMKFEQGFVNASYVVARSYDFGSTFGNDVLASSYLGENVCDCCPAAIVSSGSRSAMLYRDNFNDFRTIWCGVSNDNCQSYPFGMQVDQTSWLYNACPSSGPDGIIIGDTVYTVFMSGSTGTSKCLYSAACLNNYVSGPTIALSDSNLFISEQNFPRISNSGNKAGVVCKQVDNFNTEIAFYYTGNIHQGFSGSFDTIGTGNVANADIIMTDDAVHVVWQDDNSETVKYRKATFISSNINFPELYLISIFPSPAHDKFSFNLKNASEILNVQLTDVLGRSESIPFSISSNKVVCELKSFKAGIYMVRAIGENTFVYSGKIVVQ